VKSDNESWLPQLGLTIAEKMILLSTKEWLNDVIINAAQKLIKELNPGMSGLQDVTRGLTMSFDVQRGEFVQILHDGMSHWLTASTIGMKHPEIKVFDSLKICTSAKTKMQIASLLHTMQPSISIFFKDVQMQSGLTDCGLYF
jgi:Ulp1 family protease